MDQIYIENLELIGYHGVLEQEQELGQKFEAENQTFYPHSAWTEGSETTPYCLKSQVTRWGPSTVCLGISLLLGDCPPKQSASYGSLPRKTAVL